ncbi:hypothetical protein JET76_14220 [Pseudomonas putida]|uniref:Uncharacterized protein n=1 Tax=Pseudomonas putida TaxID=303 RepID=A0A7W2QL12_PSEPU|nr:MULTISPECIES: hypothetical protein [Pseudomonas]MBA6118543.1 hypothetical protein [Pseudomonas putida]MBI6942504.1 hypothetical protein [Pseudomonas putida]MBI6958555.1 hypothetical protein [Pseudomonas putida]MCZ9640811.1 hypothetical protein [Pseudomonas putida]MEC4877841.1 hypothetical protein [Pseudomonas sp. NC26]
MNTIKNVYAYNDEVPGEPTCFEVQGTVTVAHPGIEPVLVEPKVRHRAGWEVLELKLQDNGAIAPQVVTEKPVLFRREGACTWKQLEIIQPGGSQMVDIGHRVAED